MIDEFDKEVYLAVCKTEPREGGYISFEDILCQLNDNNAKQMNEESLTPITNSLLRLNAIEVTVKVKSPNGDCIEFGNIKLLNFWTLPEGIVLRDNPFINLESL